MAPPFPKPELCPIQTLSGTRLPTSRAFQEHGRWQSGLPFPSPCPHRAQTLTPWDRQSNWPPSWAAPGLRVSVGGTREAPHPSSGSGAGPQGSPGDGALRPVAPRVMSVNVPLGCKAPNCFHVGSGWSLGRGGVGWDPRALLRPDSCRLTVSKDTASCREKDESQERDV